MLLQHIEYVTAIDPEIGHVELYPFLVPGPWLL